MLSFRRLTLADISLVKPYFSYALSRACDNTIGGTIMWRDFFQTEFCFHNNTLIFKVIYINGMTAFSLPLGDDVDGSVREIEAYCKDMGIPLVFCTATQEDAAVYGRLFPSTRLTPDRDWSDYLYTKDDLATLAGRKFSGQRNHINYFIKNYPDHTFEEIAEANLPAVRDFYRSATSGIDKGTRIFEEERNKTFEVLDNYGEYGMIGGLLRVGDKIVAFAIGEIIKDTLHVHIERADYAFRGAYQMIVNLFAKHFADDSVAFINREEDVGDAGLRTAKEAYHPVMMIRKFTVEVI